jgi:hypothetical protein
VSFIDRFDMSFIDRFDISFIDRFDMSFIDRFDMSFIYRFHPLKHFRDQKDVTKQMSELQFGEEMEMDKQVHIIYSQACL